jgi:hypothetical protein
MEKEKKWEYEWHIYITWQYHELCKDKCGKYEAIIIDRTSDISNFPFYVNHIHFQNAGKDKNLIKMEAIVM